MVKDLLDFENMRFSCCECSHDFCKTVAELKGNPELTCPWGHVTLVNFIPNQGIRTISKRRNKAILDRRKKRKKLPE